MFLAERIRYTGVNVFFPGRKDQIYWSKKIIFGRKDQIYWSKRFFYSGRKDQIYWSKSFFLAERIRYTGAKVFFWQKASDILE